jgi:hypothetical protein
MKGYVITEEQLKSLQLLVWGAKMTSSTEPKAFADLIELIKTQEIYWDETNETQSSQ